MLLPALLGYHRYVITGDSMTGTYDRGSVLYSQEVPVEELREGDVITYVPPRSSSGNLVTHRIISIRDTRDGERVLRTKGDANKTADPGRFTLDGPTQARASFAIPYLGYAYAALSVREVRMAVIGLPAALIALALLVGLWRQAGEDAERKRRSVSQAEA